MATWTNQQKGSSSVPLTWNAATFTWDAANATTWDNNEIPFSNIAKSATPIWCNATKNTSVFTGQTKN